MSDRGRKKGASAQNPIRSEDAIASLPELLREKQEDLEKREEALKSAEKAFETEREKVYGLTTPSDVLELNVGGTSCTVLRRTLCQIDGSMLAARLSGRWDEGLEKDSAGRFMIDQSMLIFGPLLNFLRSISNESPAGPRLRAPVFKDPTHQNEFERMVEYYGCSNDVYPTEIALFRGNMETTAITQIPHISVETAAMSTFVLLADTARGSRIAAFEIELGSVQETLGGWTVPKNAITTSANINLDGDPNILSNTYEFVDVTGIALNCKRQVLCGQGTECLLQAGSVSLALGSVIRCERAGCKWFVNGTLVASGKALLDVLLGDHRNWSNDGVPAFACNGSIRVKNIMFAAMD
jgi:hypothetical protein